MKLFRGIEFDIIKGHEILYQQAYTELKDFIIKHKDEIRKTISERLLRGDYEDLRYFCKEEHLNFKSMDLILSSNQLSLKTVIKDLNKEFFDDDILLKFIHRRISRHFSVIIFDFKVSLKFKKRVKGIIETKHLNIIKKIFNKQI